MSEIVAAWLNGIGLDQYIANFEHNEIGHELLLELTDSDLKELGVTALGHRKIMLKSIESFRAAPANEERSARIFTDPAAPGNDDTTAWSRTPGERKPVTLLFADIVGSTALTEKLDAEDAHALLYRAAERMCQAVESNRGTVCRFMGDGVMAMFGAPLASEHHALEACRAALEMQAQVQRYSLELEAEHGTPIRIRVGLHSGEVVVLEVGDDPAKPEYDASGPTVPLAARMEQTAAAGSILMTDSTRKLAANWIEAAPEKPVTVKGFSEPITVFRLQRVRSASSPVAPTRSRPIVGRRSELAQFRGMLEACVETGHGHSVLIRGDPGIGKTRLTEEMMRLARDGGFACHLSLVLDFGTGKGQEAIPALVRSLLGIKQGSSKQKRRRALEKAEARGISDAAFRVYLNDLLDLPQPLELRTLYDAMEAQARIDGKHRTVARLLEHSASRQPVLLVIEGLHWADGETLEYLRYLTLAIAEIPALMIMTSRLEDDPIDLDWRARTGEHPTVTWDLGPLRSAEALELASGFIGEGNEFVQQCIERAEGNPMFLEQLLMVAEQGKLDSVPDSIKSLVLARIDQLPGEDKQALRAASVLGQRFEPDNLRRLIERPEYDCRALVEHMLLRPDCDLYMFTHALIQGGVYASLLNAQRSELHLRAAECYGEQDPVLHAEHLDRAGSAGAGGAYLRAAQKQSDSYRPERALQLVRRGLEIAPDSERFALLCLYGELLRIQGDAAASVEAYRDAAESASGEIGRCNACIGVAEGLAASGAHNEMVEVIDTARLIAEQHDLPLELAHIHYLLGSVLFYRGQIEDCLQANKASLAHARTAGSAEYEARALGGLANAEYNRGRFISAQGYFDRCIGLSRDHGFGRLIAANLTLRSYVSCWQNDVAGAIAGYREAVRQAALISDPRAEGLALLIGGSFWSLVGDLDEGEKWLRQGLKILRRIGLRLFEGVCLYLLGRVALLRGERSEARKLVEEGIAMLRESESGMTFGGPIALGILALAADDPQQCHRALGEAESILGAGSVGHNYLNFYEDAMEACLQIGDWDGVERYASALEEYTRPEPLPRSDFFIGRGRALAAYGRGLRDPAALDDLRRLQAEAQRIGFGVAREALERALAAETG
jgi:class 3 adenylate cyclase/tetratricopeptide (TPR) repeat protein